MLNDAPFLVGHSTRFRRTGAIMAKIYSNDCCQCAVPGYPCTGEHKRVPHYYCDKCKKEYEPEKLCDFYGDMICVDCLVKQFRKISDRSD